MRKETKVSVVTLWREQNQNMKSKYNEKRYKGYAIKGVNQLSLHQIVNQILHGGG